MKKWFLGLGIIIILLVCIYVFIPSTIKISTIAVVDCTKNGLYRVLTDETKLSGWLQDSNLSDSSGISSNADKYTLNKKLLNGAEILIEHNGENLNSNIILFSPKVDSTIVTWECSFSAGLNPYKRFLQYNKAVGIKKNMDVVLNRFKKFAGKIENVYDFPILKSSTNDSLLIATKFTTKIYPSVNEIYNAIQLLKNYIAKSNAIETDYPMLNVTMLGKEEFQTMVALPIDKKLEGNKTIFARQLIRGNYMTTMVTGGQPTINKALQQMQFYFDDYQKTSVAIPFQLLITDRVIEKDSAKWITKIYAPVMN